MNAPEAKRIVVVDDDLLLAEALQIAWEREEDLNIVGVAVTGTEGVELAIHTHPDVVLLDHNLPDMNGTEAMVVLSQMLPDVAVVIMTIDPTDQTLLAAVEAGASGFIGKTDGLRPVADAVRRAANGEMLIAGPTVARLLTLARDRERRLPEPTELVDPLTAREMEVLHLMAQGLDTRALAERLVLGQTTVRTHVAAILAKLEVHSRLEAVVKASRLNLLP